MSVSEKVIRARRFWKSRRQQRGAVACGVASVVVLTLIATYLLSVSGWAVHDATTARVMGAPRNDSDRHSTSGSISAQSALPSPPLAAFAHLDRLDPLPPRPNETFITFGQFIDCLGERLRVRHREEEELPIADDEVFFPYMVIPVTFEIRELKAFVCNVSIPFKHLMIVQNWDIGSMSEFLGATRQIFSFTSRLEIRHFPRNRGYAGALNLAMRDAMTFSFDEVPFFFMSNTDVRFSPGLLETSLPRIHAGALGGHALLEQFKSEVASEPNEYTPEAFRGVPLRSTDDQHLLVSSPSLPDRVRYMDQAQREQVFRDVDGYYYLDQQQQTAVWGLSRLAMETVGFFDENCFPAYHEDTDLLLRLGLIGLRAVYVEPHRVGVMHLVNNMFSTERAFTTAKSLGDILVFLRGITEVSRFMLPSEYVAVKPQMISLEPYPSRDSLLLPPDVWVLNERRRLALEEMIRLSMEYYAQPHRAPEERRAAYVIAFVPFEERQRLLALLSPIIDAASLYHDGNALRRVSIPM
ncbi:hypothetical protein LSCM1_01117 [Leishmania martiniquensis]|uniref:Uncharacterized protein n=1 Tax=Leishmania martiniquensis TaxID=1580590 RepID=A0A836KDL6_9TRYP|nr:hypothetical protein LSCM1_01111 [Leishmania martiniquensis]KAG5466940.1 hypothetical protein LSCM1_01117 [Leishmania martiniquensis]